MRSVGIDIGSSSIKVVEASVNNKGQMRIQLMQEHILNTNPAFDPEIQIIEFLKNLAATYNPEQTRFVLGLKQDKVSVRRKTFPFSDRLKISKSLPFELEDDLPFSNDNAVFDAKIISYTGSGAEVLACATPNNRVADLIKRFGDVGFEIAIASVDGIALANTYERWWEAPPLRTPKLEIAGSEAEKTAIDVDPEAPSRPQTTLDALIYIGHTTTLVHAIDNGRLVGVRSILWGMKQVAEAIARRYEIPYVEALKEMQTKAFVLPSKAGASYDQIVFSDTISAQFKDLARDLKICLLELSTELTGEFRQVEISGGGAQVIQLPAILTMQLELPVNVKNLLTGFASSSTDSRPHLESVCGVALGLAIEGLKKPRNPALQLLRGEFAKQNAQLQGFIENWGRVAFFVAGVFVTALIYTSVRSMVADGLLDQVSEALKKQGQTVAHLGKKKSSESEIKKFLKEQKKHGKEMQATESLVKMNSALDVLKKLSESVPGKTNITLNVKVFKVVDDHLTLEMVLANNNQVVQMQKAMMAMAVDGRLEPRNPSISAPAGSVAYAASIKIDRGLR